MSDLVKNDAAEQDYLKAKTLGQLLDEIADRQPEQDALVYADRDFRQSWAEFRHEVDTLARGLMALGVGKGDKLALWATNVPHWLTFMFASAKIGAVLITVNTHYKRAEMEYLMRQSEAEYLVLIDSYRDNDFMSTLYEMAPELRGQDREHLKCAGLPHLKKAFFLGQEKHRGLYSFPEILDMSRMVAKEELAERQASTRPDEVVNMQYTSGTTGFPKGVMLSHQSILTNGYWIGYHQTLSPEDRVCLPVPLFHCFGCVLGVMACVNHGAAMIVLESYDPVAVMTAVESEKATALYGVPTMFIAVLEHPAFKKFDFSTLRTGIMAGSPCPVKTMREVIELMHAREITICYGLTEASPVLTQTRADDNLQRRTETVGRPMPGIEVKVVDPETFEEKPAGEIGEVVCRGYNLMKGYYNMPEATAAAIDREGWLHSGDLGRFDESGYLYITGRWKDMIIRGGENVYPMEIEEYIRHMPGVVDVQVVGVPSKRYGEEVAAFIISAPDAEMVPSDVRHYLSDKISKYKIPRYMELVGQFPLTASGKVQKYRLREQAAQLWPDA